MLQRAIGIKSRYTRCRIANDVAECNVSCKQCSATADRTSVYDVLTVTEQVLFTVYVVLRPAYAKGNGPLVVEVKNTLAVCRVRLTFGTGLIRKVCGIGSRSAGDTRTHITLKVTQEQQNRVLTFLSHR